MADALKAKDVPVEAFEGSMEVAEIQYKIEDVLCKETSFIELARRAYQNYLKSLDKSNRKIFDITSVDPEKFAR